MLSVEPGLCTFLVEEYLTLVSVTFPFLLSLCSWTCVGLADGAVDSGVLRKRQQLSGKQAEPGSGPKAERKLCGRCRPPAVGLGYGAF